MSFSERHIDVPAALRTDEFLLRPIRTSDAELDYEAVMESREYLRKWEQSSWPEDDFSVEANRKDLERLEQRHTDGECFTFTVLDPGETRCLGCVYIFPSDALLFTKSRIVSIDGSQWSQYKAAVYFWVRKSRLADELDRRLLGALKLWLERDWRIDKFLTVTSEQSEQQVKLIESTNLQRRFQIKAANKPSEEVAYA